MAIREKSRRSRSRGLPHTAARGWGEQPHRARCGPGRPVRRRVRGPRFARGPPLVTVSLFTEIDHVAIAVRDLDAAAAWYGRTFGAEVVHRERVERDQVEEALLQVADSYIQLLMPVGPASSVSRFLDRRGEGLHHVAYRVDDCAAALRAAVAAGAVAIDDEPRPGSRGTTVAFLHPSVAFGTLIELVQE